MYFIFLVCLWKLFCLLYSWGSPSEVTIRKCVLFLAFPLCSTNRCYSLRNMVQLHQFKLSAGRLYNPLPCKASCFGTSLNVVDPPHHCAIRLAHRAKVEKGMSCPTAYSRPDHISKTGVPHSGCLMHTTNYLTSHRIGPDTSCNLGSFIFKTKKQKHCMFLFI